MITSPSPAALVLFSGGQDSTVCLAWAMKSYARVETVGFTYGQRHTAELECRPRIREGLKRCLPEYAGRLGEDHVLDVAVLGQLSESALVQKAEFAFMANGLPNTFVPGRNLLFFTLAAALGVRRSLFDLVGGMCQTDYSGYPDCRNDTLITQQTTLKLGIDKEFNLRLPLMWRNKAETWAMTADLGGIDLVELVVEETHTCYKGDRKHRHAWGYGCNACPACVLRAKGYEAWVGRIKGH